MRMPRKTQPAAGRSVERQGVSGSGASAVFGGPKRREHTPPAPLLLPTRGGTRAGWSWLRSSEAPIAVTFGGGQPLSLWRGSKSLFARPRELDPPPPPPLPHTPTHNMLAPPSSTHVPPPPRTRLALQVLRLLGDSARARLANGGRIHRHVARIANGGPHRRLPNTGACPFSPHVHACRLATLRRACMYTGTTTSALACAAACVGCTRTPPAGIRMALESCAICPRSQHSRMILLL